MAHIPEAVLYLGTRITYTLLSLVAEAAADGIISIALVRSHLHLGSRLFLLFALLSYIINL